MAKKIKTNQYVRPLLTKPDYALKRKAYATQIFVNADLRANHKGLTSLAKAYGTDIAKLESGNLVLFINRRRTMAKAYACNETIAFIKPSHGISLNVLKFLPKTFGAPGYLSYDAALVSFLAATEP